MTCHNNLNNGQINSQKTTESDYLIASKIISSIWFKNKDKHTVMKINIVFIGLPIAEYVSTFDLEDGYNEPILQPV